jgi:hypothetical protein
VTALRRLAWIEANAFWLSIIITLVGAGLRLYALGARSVWFDEAIEVLIARSPFGQIQTVAVSWAYGDPPLLSWLLHFTLKLGSSEFIWRWPAVMAGILAVAGSYRLFRLWLNAPQALMAQVVFTLAPAQVYYSQEVNQYALLVASSVFIYWTYERAVRQPGLRRMIGLGLAGVLGVLTHYGCVWLVAGLALTVPFRVKPVNWWRWWPVGLILGVAMAGLYVWIIQPEFQKMQQVVPAATSAPQLSVAELQAAGQQLWSTAHFLTDARGGLNSPPVVETLLFVIVLVIGLGYAVTRSNLAVLAVLLIVPLGVSYFAFKFGLYFWGQRYLLFISPIFYLLIGLGLAVLGKQGRLFKLVPLAAVAILVLDQVYPGTPNQELGENLRPVTQHVEATRRPDDGIYVYYGAEPAFLVYYTGTMDRVKIGRWFRSLPLAAKMADIEPLIAAHPRWWFVASHMVNEEVEAILAELDRQCPRLDFFSSANALAAEYDCSSSR